MRRLAVVVLALVCVGPRAEFSQPAIADEPGPIVVIAAASVNRLLGDVDAIGAAAERPDLPQTLRGFLATVGNLEGLDRDRPFGALVYPGEGLGAKPDPVAFVPVADRERFLKTLEFGPLRVVAGNDDRHELKGPDGSVHFRLAGNWAYFAQKPASLGRTFPDPEGLTAGLVERFDVAAVARLGEIPDGLKLVLVGAMKGRVELESARATQEKNDAGSDEEQLRRAATQAVLATAERLVMETQEAIVGWKISPETKLAAVEAELVLKRRADAPANPGAELLPPIAALDATAPLRFCVTGTIPAAYREVAQTAVRLVEKRGKAEAKAAGDTELIGRILGPLQATAADGRVDFVAQLVGAAPGPFTLVGGAGVREAEGLAAALPEAVRKAAARPDVQEAAIDAAKAGGVSLHRVTGRSPRPLDERLYGPKPSLLVGAGRGAAWFAVGGADASEALARLIDSKPEDVVRPRPVFHLAINAATWVAMGDNEGNDDTPRQLARDAFSRGRDGLKLELLPTAAGVRLRLDLEEGFLRLAGLAAGRKADGR